MPIVFGNVEKNESREMGREPATFCVLSGRLTNSAKVEPLSSLIPSSLLWGLLFHVIKPCRIGRICD